MKRTDAAIGDLARHRHGLFTSELAFGAGLSRAHLRSRAGSGMIAPCYDRIPVVGTVWRLTSAVRTDEQRVLAAVLAGGEGAMAAGRTSLRLWDVELPGRFLIEITVPRGRHPHLPDVVISRPAFRLDDRPVRRHRIPCSNPLRALIELGAAHPALVPDALEQLLADQRVTLAAARDLRLRHARRGHDGVGVLGRVLEERALGDKPPDSVLEPAMAALLAAHDLPPMVFHHRLRLDGRTYEPDFALPYLRLAVEVDGIDSHGTPEAFERDRERDALLAGAGWQVIRITWLKVKRRPGWVAQRIRDTIAARRSLLGPALVV